MVGAWSEKIPARPVQACDVVRAWRGRSWRPPTPKSVSLVVRLAEPLAHSGAGIGMPDHGGYCDPVFSALDPEDAFCG